MQDAANRVFVDPARGSDSNNGRRATPFKTLERALDAAESLTEPEVYFGGGQLLSAEYSALQLFDFGKIGLYGGYNTETWQRDPAQVSMLWTDEAYAVILTSSEVTLDGFSIKTGSANSGQTGSNGKAGTDGAGGKVGTGYGGCPPGKAGGGGGAGSGGGGAGGKGGTGTAFAGGDGANGASVSGAVGGSGGDGGPLNLSGQFGGDGENALNNIQIASGGDNLGRQGEDGVSTERSGAGAGGGGGSGGVIIFVCGGGGGGGGVVGAAADPVATVREAEAARGWSRSWLMAARRGSRTT